MIDGIKSQTDKLNFNSDNDVKATLDDEEVTTDSASRDASKATGFATPANVTAARDNIKTAITTAHTTTDGKIDTVDTVVDGIKTQTDKMQFTDVNDIKATLDSETVSLDTDTETKIDTIKGRTDKLLFRSETASGTQEQLHTFTDVDVTLPDNTQVNINLDTLEDGILDIQKQLKNNAAEGEPATLLDRLQAVGVDVAYIRDLEDADVEQDGMWLTYKRRGTDQVLMRFHNRGRTAGRIDWSAGRRKPTPAEESA